MPIFLFISGFCSLKFSSAEFHFVNSNKNYTSAQSFCREKFTDLATVGNSSDERSLVAALPDDTVRAWIGLQVAGAATWYWTTPEQQLSFLNWEEGEPKDTSPESCGAMNSDGRWVERGCTTERGFVCEGNETHGPIFFAEKKTWRLSQDHCRGLSSDLVSIQSAAENGLVNSSHAEASVWIGLFKDPWKWSDGSKSSYRFWKPNKPNNNDQNCVVIVNDNGKWNNLACHTKRRFICHGASTISPTSSPVTQDKTIQTVVTFPPTDGVKTTLQSPTLSVLTATTHTTATMTKKTTGENHTFEVTTLNIIEPLSNLTSSHAPNNVTETQQQPLTTTAHINPDNPTVSSDDTTAPATTRRASTDNLILIQRNMSWNEACSYCRKHHEALASVHSEELQQSVARVAQSATSPHVWLGLRYTCSFHFWFWIKWDAGCYQNWAPEHGAERRYDCGMAGALQTTRGQRWVGLPETEQLNFICYTCAEAAPDLS